MNASVKVEKNPGQPEGRWFEIAGRPQSLQSLHVLRSKDEAFNAGFMMADRIFGVHQASEVRLYPFEGHDYIAVFLKTPSEWDKISGTGGSGTVEDAVSSYLNDRLLLRGYALLRDMSDKPESTRNANDIAGRMNDHLQKIKPETVDQHGGKVHVVEFNKNSGLLTIALSEACSSGCNASSLGTKAAIAPRMRSRFPEITKIDFIFK